MDLRRTVTIPPMPSNMTDQEVVGLVRHYYPDLSGLLLEMRNRLEDYCDDDAVELRKEIEDLKTEIDEQTTAHEEGVDHIPIKCPDCGSQWKLV